MKDQDKEFAMSMEVPEQAENGQVADKLQEILEFLFSNNAKAVAVKVLPEEHKLYIKPFSFFKAKLGKSFFRVQSVLKDEFWHKDFAQVSFIFSDTFVEIWNKFMPMEFVFEYDSETHVIKMLWDVGMDDTQIKAYWYTNDRDGYNINGTFWSREWLKPEHKESTNGGGKIDR